MEKIGLDETIENKKTNKMKIFFSVEENNRWKEERVEKLPTNLLESSGFDIYLHKIHST